jgi:hypothetical protein
MIGGLGGLVSESTSILGSMKTRNGQTPVLVIPQRRPYTGPLVILIDGSTQSAAEVFASGMKDTHRAVIIGDVSAGNTLPSAILKLPTGALFQYAFGNYQSPEGIFLEGRGVIPDQIVKLNRRGLLRGGDPQLAAAVNTLRSISSIRQRELIADVTTVELTPPKPKGDPVITVKAPAPVNLKSESAEAPAPEATPKDPNARTIEEIINHYIEAVGGEEALLKIKSRVSRGTVELPMGLMGTVEIYEQTPNRSSLIMNLAGFGIVQQTFDGKLRWIQDPVRGYLSIPSSAPDGGDDLHRELGYRRLIESLRFERMEKVNDRLCFVLNRVAGGTVIERLFFDFASGLLVRENNTYMEDYREVDGVKVPFVTRETAASGMSSIVRLKEVKHNVAIDETKFAERPDCFTRPEQNWRIEKSLSAGKPN